MTDKESSDTTEPRADVTDTPVQVDEYSFGYVAYSEHSGIHNYLGNFEVSPSEVQIEELEVTPGNPYLKFFKFTFIEYRDKAIPIRTSIRWFHNWTLVPDLRGDSGVPYSTRDIRQLLLPTSTIRIGAGAFFLTPRTSITIPNKVLSISATFDAGTGPSNHVRPEKIVFEGTPLHINSMAFDGVEKVIVPWKYGDVANAPWGAGAVEYESGVAGTLTVVYGGSGVPEGAQWSIDDGETWNDFGTTIERHASYVTVKYKAVTGYTEPAIDRDYIVAATETLITSGVYIEAVPEDELWYYADHKVTPHQTTGIIEHTFADGKGVLKFAEPVIDVKGWLASTEIINVAFPSGVQSIGASAFSGCALLELTKLPDSVTTISKYAFHKCSKLGLRELPHNISSIGKGAFSYCVNISVMKIPDTIVRIEEDTFYGCTGLLYLEIPETLTYIGDQAFSDCTELVIGYQYNHLFEHIGAYAFNKCYQLDLYEAVDSYVGWMYAGTGAFAECRALYQGIYKLAVIESNVYAGCTNLSDAGMANACEQIGDGAFSGCCVLDVSGLPSLISIGRYAFSGCKVLHSLKSLRFVEGIGDHAFSGCEFLQLDNIGWADVIGDGAFSGCKRLELPSGYYFPSVKYLGNEIFSGCEKITSIHMYERPRYIAKSAFSGISALYVAWNVETVPNKRYGAARVFYQSYLP